MEMKEENDYSAENRDRSRSPVDEDSRDRDRDRDGDSNERERDRNRRMDRSRRTDRQRGGGRRAPVERRIYVSNIPYEYKWQDLKDLFRKEVGEVSYVEMFNDENNRPRGCAVIEFESTELVQKAVEIMHRYELKGRKLVVKEKADELPLAHLAQIRLGNRMVSSDTMDFDSDRERHRGGIMKSDMRGGREFARGADIGPQGMANKFGNTFGLSTVFLESLGITGPLVNKVFVANLDYKVDEKMLKDVFKIAGKVVSVEISKDQDNKSRGFGVVEFEHPVEAVQSISMLHNQTYYDRKMSVRMDRVSEKQESTATKLPPGLKGLGMGLGINGSALTDVATLPNAVAQGVTGMANVGAMASNMGNMGGGGGGGQNMGGMGMMGMGGGGMGGGMDNMNSGMGGNMGGGGMGGNMGGGSMGGNMGGGGMGGGMGNGMMGNMGMGTGMGNMGSGMNSSNMGSGLGGGLGSSLGGGSGFMNSNMNRGAIGASSVGSGSGSGYGSYGSTGLSRDYNHSSSSSNSYTRNVIQLSNLPMDYTWQALRDLCREFGDIRFAEIRSKGTGTVRFQTEADARRAVEMLDRQRLDGRILDVCQL
ncbi:heterogeneous nuclear ribonucleoprotein M-like isoform X3 [Penaeus chinensis]|uniref:heterogeneous nuclear ribonucleoprotein M-like isoform X3 n=1 Tax=Penaeus chinensis TaxID=139456 RepID=UPI001FB66722|nr:heterogeneous nuclear ribonucleoprotein M-like isoform X3 [Penaeus chinensis]